MSRWTLRTARRSGVVVLAAAMLLSACSGTPSPSAPPDQPEPTTSEPTEEPVPEYPTKEVELIVPFDAGGFTDSSARVVAEYLKEVFGQPITVINKAGAGGVTATTEYVRATPDGYSIMSLISGPTTEALASTPDLPYHWDSFSILGGIALSPRVVVAPVGGRFATGEALVEALSTDPGSVKWATGSPQGPATFSTLALFDQLDVDVAQPQRVTFNGDGPAANAVAGGHVDFSAVNVSTALPLIEAGKLVPLIVSGADEIESLPGTPVAADLGLEEFILDNWIGFMAPAETPQHVVDAWGAALEELSKNDKLEAQLADMGSVMQLITASELTEMVRNRYETSRALVEKFGTSE